MFRVKGSIRGIFLKQAGGDLFGFSIQVWQGFSHFSPD